jgi:hypothetical protein
MLRLWQQIDICDLARQGALQDLGPAGRHDAIVPYEEGRLMVSLIPSAESVTLDSANHLSSKTPARATFGPSCRFPLPQAAAQLTPSAGFDDLSEREREVPASSRPANDDIAVISRSAQRPCATTQNIFGKVSSRAGDRARGMWLGYATHQRPARHEAAVSLHAVRWVNGLAS